MDPAIEFFQFPQQITHKQYEALRAFYLEGKSAAEVAQQFGYTVSAVYSLTRDFTQQLKQPNPSEQFLVTTTLGRKPKEQKVENDQLILSLRKKDLSVSDIKAILDSLGYEVSQRYIYHVIAQTGMKKLSRRSKQIREQAIASVKLPAPPSKKLTYIPETFRTPYSAGVLCLLPYIQTYAIHKLIENSDYPESQNLNRISSSMVIKVDFDLTMSILAHNLYRLLATDLPGFGQSTSTSLFNKFICNSAQVQIDSHSITMLMKKKRNLPALLTALEPFQNLPLSWMQNRKFRLFADTTS